MDVPVTLGDFTDPQSSQEIDQQETHTEEAEIFLQLDVSSLSKKILHENQEGKWEQLPFFMEAKMESTSTCGNSNRNIVNSGGGGLKKLPVYTQWTRLLWTEREG